LELPFSSGCALWTTLQFSLCQSSTVVISSPPW
jgi:hypothetical protein